jgi:hypothetical protein
MELEIVMNDHCQLLTKCCFFLDRLKIQDGHQRPYGKYVKQTSSQEPLDGLEPYSAEMFLAVFLSSVVTFCSDCPTFKMAAVTKDNNAFNCPLLL